MPGDEAHTEVAVYARHLRRRDCDLCRMKGTENVARVLLHLAVLKNSALLIKNLIVGMQINQPGNKYIISRARTMRAEGASAFQLGLPNDEALRRFCTP